ncbi:MAG: heparan N-sulfatase [Planctomycetaceae bacterium]|nr:MAG: heparan N-sulfatase [Planctomycetaceae bacterium]
MMPRESLFEAMLSCVVGVVVVTGLLTSVRGNERPHVVVFLADDLSLHECSPYGGSADLTPHMNQLAREGMTFTQAFVTSPSCAPSRASLLTGLYPIQHGAMLNHARPHSTIKTWPQYFRELGYETVAIGKVAHYAQVTEYGFDLTSHYRYHEDDCIDYAVSWLAQRRSSRPLCLIVGTNWPHVPWPEEENTSFQPMPTCLIPTAETRQAYRRYLQAVQWADRDLGKIHRAVREHLGENVLFVFSSDHGAQFPFAKWNCYDYGVHVPLIICWPKKVAAGMRSSALISWIDLLPTLLAACGGKPPMEIAGRSFLPVLLGHTAQHREVVILTHSGDGQKNRYPQRAVRTARWKYIRNLNPSARHTTHIDTGNAGDGAMYFNSWIRLADHDASAASVVQRYHHRPSEELYDLERDPWELHNLAAEPDYAEQLHQLRVALDRWMEQHQDRGLATEQELPPPRASSKKSRKSP